MISSKDSFGFSLPVQINFGIDSSLTIDEKCKSLGKKFLIVTSKDIPDISNKILSIMNSSNFQTEIFYIESKEPSTIFIDNSTKILKEKTFDGIIGLGGGSAMDIAKSLSISMINPLPIWEYANLSDRPAKPIEFNGIPIIAIPTTAGTGSEVTPYAVLSNIEQSRKGTIQNPYVFPKFAIIDPKLMISLPSTLTASTGIDAFAHALESYLNISKPSPISEITAIESLKLIFMNLPKVFTEHENLDSRYNMALASTLAGIAISHRGTTTPHGIAETIGGITKLPHAICVAASTLPVLKETLDYITKPLSDLSEQIFPTHITNDQQKNVHLFYDFTENLLQKIHLNKPIQEYFETSLPDKIDEVILDSLQKYKFRPLEQHPKIFDAIKLKEIINNILYGCD